MLHLQGYGRVSVERQGEILAELAQPSSKVDAVTEIAVKI
jgi:hypothetical protein